MTHHNSDEFDNYQGVAPLWAAPPAPAPQKKKRRKRNIIGASIGAVLAIIVVAAVSGNNTAAAPAPAGPSLTVAPSIPDTTAYAPATTEAPAPPAPVVPTGPATTVSDGTYEVGVDMEPGKYKGSCVDGYWARMKDDSGSNFIANDIKIGPATMQFTTKKGEYVEVDRCTFTKVG